MIFGSVCLLLVEKEDEMERKIYFKIVQRLNLTSLIEDLYNVSYKIGKCVQTHPKLAAKGYYLLVFGSLSSARSFGVGTEGKVFSCHIKGRVRKLPPIRDDAYHVFLSPPSRVCPGGWPYGTVMAKEVKLLEEVI